LHESYATPMKRIPISRLKEPEKNPHTPVPLRGFARRTFHSDIAHFCLASTGPHVAAHHGNDNGQKYVVQVDLCNAQSEVYGAHKDNPRITYGAATVRPDAAATCNVAGLAESNGVSAASPTKAA